MSADTRKLVRITLDEPGVVRLSPRIEHERRVAIHDLLEENTFHPAGDFEGPFVLHLEINDNRLVFNVHDEADAPLISFALPLGSFRALIKDYFMVCDSYFKAIQEATPSRIEAIDMGRRGLHDEGAEMLRERLEGKAEIDADTARRLFTLVCVMHIRS